MKRYTVKEVIKMEDRMRYLNEIEHSRLDEEFLMPLAILGSLGLVFLSPAANSQGSQLIPLILGSATTLFGFGTLAHFVSAGMRSDKLYDKIEKIYEVMGDDFKQKVEEEIQILEKETNERSR